MLSVVVPTYNRAQLLAWLLESVVHDLGQFPVDLELIVSDNASSDETRAVVGKFIQRGFPIKYFVNETNIGADANFEACFNLASGKYFWLIGDDEVMYRGSVMYVLEFCRRKEFGILHLASQGFSLGQQAAVSLRERPDEIDIATLDSNSLFRRANVFLTFITANVINRKAVLSRFPDFDATAELNTNLLQLAWTYGALKAANVHYYVRTPLFGALGGNTGGYKLIEVFGANLKTITRKYLHDAIPKAERIMTNAVVTLLLPGQLVDQFGSVQKKNQFANENFSKSAKSCFRRNLYFNIFVRPLFVNSETVRRGTYFLVGLFNRINARLGFILL